MSSTDMASSILVGMLERSMAHAMSYIYWFIALWLVVVLVGLTVAELRSARRTARVDRDLRQGLGDLSRLRRR